MSSEDTPEVLVTQATYILSLDEQQFVAGAHSGLCGGEMRRCVTDENATILFSQEYGTDGSSRRRSTAESQ